jgi:hypothetical protein
MCRSTRGTRALQRERSEALGSGALGEYSARRLSRPVGRNEARLSSLHRGQERRCVNKDRRLPSEPMGNSGGLATVDCQNGSQPSARDQPSPGRW